MKHTPGPWYTCTKESDRQGLIYQENTGKNIAVSYNPQDANLIAAAPELLETATWALEILTTLNRHQKHLGIVDKMFNDNGKSIWRKHKSLIRGLLDISGLSCSF